MNKVCEHCGVGYTSKQPASKFCTASCGSKARWSNRNKNKFDLVCQECKSEYKGQDIRQKFCSRSCAAKRNNIRYPKRGKVREGLPSVCVRNSCHNLLGYNQKSYCTDDCKYQEEIALWEQDSSFGSTKFGTKSFVRTYIMNRCGGVCEGEDSRTRVRCTEDRIKANGISVLELDHIDGNWENNHKSNLRMLCPTCHALTETYRGMNRGNGREYRRLTRTS